MGCTSSPEGRLILRIVVSSVAKRASCGEQHGMSWTHTLALQRADVLEGTLQTWDTTPADVSLLSRQLLPALVYPTKDTTGTAASARFLVYCSLVCCT